MYDDILKTLGEFGTYQKRFLMIAMCLSLVSGPTQLLSIFILATPNHRCAIPGYDNDTYVIQNGYHGDLINQSVPEFSSCLLRNQTIDIYGNVTSVDFKCTSWVYDTSTFISTIVTEFNLVCDDSGYQSTAVVIIYIGQFVGYGLLGGVADIIGRKPLMVVSNYMFVLAYYLLIWSPNYTFIVCLRFIQGVFHAGHILSIYTIGLEIVGPNKRIYSGVASSFIWCFGIVVFTGFAYFIRDWRHLQIAVSVYVTYILLYFLFIPESPRWLLTRGYTNRAKTILLNMAKVNKVEMNEEQLKGITVSDKVTKVKFWRMFTSRRLCVRTLVIYITWFSASFTYYGIMLNVDDLSGSTYTNLTAMTVIEIISYIVVLALTDKIGRKKMLCGGFVLSILSYIICICISLYAPTDLQWLLTAVAIGGRFGVVALFCVLWFWTGELFPTELRNSGTGSSSTVARLGSVLAPYIGLMSKNFPGEFGKVSSFIIYGGACLISLILVAIFLPETSYLHLPETVDDCKTLGRRIKANEVTKNGTEMVTMLDKTPSHDGV